jgi:guanine nucleotide-binding protein subunit alpha-12
MQIIHGCGFSIQDKLIFRTQIYENVLKGIAGLLNGKRELKLPWRGNSINQSTMMNEESNSSNSQEISAKMINILKNFLTIYKQLMDDRESESIRINHSKFIHILPDQFRQCVYLIIEIWNDDSIRETFERRREYPRYFVENVPYFIEILDKISSLEYLPDSDDILRARRATTGINEIEMDIKKVPFRFVDVGGQRTQRQKWHQCFSDVTAILFLASSSEYDEYLR